MTLTCHGDRYFPKILSEIGYCGLDPRINPLWVGLVGHSGEVLALTGAARGVRHQLVSARVHARDAVAASNGGGVDRVGRYGGGGNGVGPVRHGEGRISRQGGARRLGRNCA